MYELNSLVIIKNDPNKTIYKVIEIIKDEVILKGYNTRTKLKCLINELEECPIDILNIEKQKEEKLILNIKKYKKRNNKYLFGRILHIDGDQEYLENCLNLYKIIGIKASCIYIKEKEIKDKIEKIIEILTPDIIVLTGHDSFNDLDKTNIENYENTKYFGDGIRVIRKHFSDCVVIAGACKSFYEYLIAQGANFATSPGRINTHIYDPAVLAIKVATTSVNMTIDFFDCLKYIEGKEKAVGGVETKGKMRIIY